MNKLAVVTLASLTTQTDKELVSYIVEMCETGRAAYLNATKAIVVLSQKIGLTEAKAALKRAGVKDSTIKNAMQLVFVYQTAVETGAASEDWFNSVNFTRAVAFNRAVTVLASPKASGIKVLSDLKPSVLSGSESAWLEIETIAETGMTKEQRAAAKAKETEAAAKGGKGEESGETSTKTSTESETTKKATNPLAEIEDAAQKLTELVLAFAPKADEVAAEKVSARLAAVAKAWADGREVIAARRKTG